MPLSKAHKERTRERILTAAGRLFRRHGYAEIGVDRIMAEAGLTRGGFYNHFPSKAALFAEVLGADHGLVRQIAARDGVTAPDRRAQAREIFAAYLDPAHLTEVGQGCTLASLANDAARADRAARGRFTEIYGRLVGDLVPDLSKDLPKEAEAEAHRILALAIGTLSIARAIDDPDIRNGLLRAVSADIDARLR